MERPVAPKSYSVRALLTKSDGDVTPYKVPGIYYRLVSSNSARKTTS